MLRNTWFRPDFQWSSRCSIVLEGVHVLCMLFLFIYVY